MIKQLAVIPVSVVARQPDFLITPVGVPSTWVHHMVVVAKADGTCRRVVNLSPLNKYCVRETHHVKPPFIQVCVIPANT